MMQQITRSKLALIFLNAFNQQSENMSQTLFQDVLLILNIYFVHKILGDSNKHA